MTKKSKGDGTLTDGTDSGFWLDWISQEEIDSLPGERKKSEVREEKKKTSPYRKPSGR